MPDVMKAFVLLASLSFGGCIGIFANDFEIDFEAELVSAETVTDDLGTRVVCRMRLTATAIGEDGEEGVFGEAGFAYRSVANDAYLGGERRSAAFMASRFGSESLASGAAASTNVFERAWPEAFNWEMAINFRRPGGTRGTEEITLRCG